MANYWKDHEAHLSHKKLLKCEHMGRVFEMFRTEYKRTANYEGGVYLEAYLDGEHFHDEQLYPEDPDPNVAEWLDEVIHLWETTEGPGVSQDD